MRVAHGSAKLVRKRLRCSPRSNTSYIVAYYEPLEITTGLLSTCNGNQHSIVPAVSFCRRGGPQRPAEASKTDLAWEK